MEQSHRARPSHEPSRSRWGRPDLRCRRLDLRTLLWAVALGIIPMEAVAEQRQLSLEVHVDGAYVRTSPSAYGARRGTLAEGARLPALGQQAGEGCQEPWYRIGREAWVCGEMVRQSPAPPAAPLYPVVEEGQVVPHRYGFARGDGARCDPTVDDAGYDEWERQFDPQTLFRGAGVGAQLVTPFGPLGLDYAYGFDRRVPGWQLHFRMGPGY